MSLQHLRLKLRQLIDMSPPLLCDTRELQRFRAIFMFDRFLLILHKIDYIFSLHFFIFANFFCSSFFEALLLPSLRNDAVSYLLCPFFWFFVFTQFFILDLLLCVLQIDFMLDALCLSLLLGLAQFLHNFFQMFCLLLLF